MYNDELEDYLKYDSIVFEIPAVSCVTESFWTHDILWRLKGVWQANRRVFTGHIMLIFRQRFRSFQGCSATLPLHPSQKQDSFVGTFTTFIYQSVQGQNTFKTLTLLFWWLANTAALSAAGRLCNGWNSKQHALSMKKNTCHREVKLSSNVRKLPKPPPAHAPCCNNNKAQDRDEHYTAHSMQPRLPAEMPLSHTACIMLLLPRIGPACMYTPEFLISGYHHIQPCSGKAS